MTKLVLPFVETMATQVCNLSCEGCTNYSDFNHAGYISWNNMREQLISWLKIIDIPDFGIIGGEPLINPDIKNWLTGARELMPETQIRFTTNGTLLHKKLDVLDVAHEIGNVIFKITVHQANAELENIIKQIFARYSWEPVNEYGIDRWVTKNLVRFQINRPTAFIKTYQGLYNNMKPWQSSPQDSFELCVQKTCPLLHNGKIYKCSTQGLLKETLAKFNNPNIKLWQNYLIDGISPTSEIAAIEQFIDNFNKPHSICAMCPNSTNSEAILDHTTTVRKK